MASTLNATVGSVHLWWADLVRDEREINRLQELLSPLERERAARFRTAESRRRFVAARGILRTLLGRYLAKDPAEVSLSVGEHGKPQLAGPLPSLHFNVSHADDLAVYAFAEGSEVGVDVERIQPVAEWETIATTYFAEPEAATLATLPETQRTTAFIGAWTRHEARFKVSGQGWGPTRPVESATFSFCPIEPPPGFAAALAVEGPPAVIRDWGFIST